MADETTTTKTPTSMNDIFDDSDDSDEEMAQPSTQPSQPSSSKDVNAGLFGSDSDDSDDDDDKPAAEVNPPKDNEAAADANVDTNVDADADADAIEKNNANNSEEESGDEFQDDGITGRKAPARSTSTKRITVPKIPLPQFGKKTTTLHMAQLPKVVSIQSEAHNPDTYDSKLEDVEFNERSHTMIRWRYKTDENGEMIRDENGKLVRESNAKIIKWSDGTYGLRVGDEVFDMDENSYSLKKKGEAKTQKNAKATDATESNNTNPDSKDFLYLTQQVQAEENGEMKAAGTLLECVAPLTSKFKPRPAILTSQSHRNFVLKERSRVMKRAQIQEFNTFVDPEKEKAEKIRNKDDLMKDEKKRGGRRSTGGSGGRKRYGMHRNYMDEDDEHYDTVNIRTLKRKNDDDDMDYGEDGMDYGEEDEWSKRKKRGFESGRKVTKQYLSDEDDDDQELVLDNEDDEEEEILNRKNTSRGAGQKRKADLFDDDDSD